MSDPGVLTDLDIFVAIDHPRAGDLVAELLPPAPASTVPLLDRPGFPTASLGCQGEDVLAFFDGAAATAAEDACSPKPPALLGVLRPLGTLSALHFGAVEGTWRLVVRDAVAGEAGAITGWCLLPALAPGDVVFADGFESGDVTAWSETEP